MVKKPKRKVKRYAGKTDEAWRDWGEKFGKRMEKRGKEFGEEMEGLGERISKRFEHRAKKWDKEYKDWWFFSLGFIGPLIGSIFGIICLALGVWVLKFVNLPLGSSFISELSNFILASLPFFFAVFLFFGYTDYFSKKVPKIYWIFSPIANSIGAVITILILVLILNLINNYIGSSLIASVSNFLRVNLSGIFVLFIVLGYILITIKKFVMKVLSD